jgi:rhodanese-related sulfurtransferase
MLRSARSEEDSMTTVTADPAARIALSPREVMDLLASGRARLIDVREPDEHRAERIAEAALHPSGTLDPAALGRKPGEILVVHCRSGRRGVDAVQRLRAAGHAETFNLEGGIEAWRAAGLPTLRTAGASRLPIMRQVQIVVGTCVAIFTALGAFVNLWFLAVPAFMGCGLLFAGLTGTCGMAAMLGVMPWNRVPAGGVTTTCSPR